MEFIDLKQLERGTTLLIEGDDGDLFELISLSSLLDVVQVSANDTRIPNGTMAYVKAFHGLGNTTPDTHLTPSSQLQLNFENGFLRSSHIKSITLRHMDWHYILGETNAQADPPRSTCRVGQGPT